MFGEQVDIRTAAYSFRKKSGLSSGGTILLFRLGRPGPLGRPAMIQAIGPMPGTKMIMTNQAHFGRLRIFASGVLEQSRIA